MKKHYHPHHRHTESTGKQSTFPAILAGRFVDVKLAVSVSILGGLLLLRSLAPAAFSDLRAQLSSSVDLRAAFAAVGEGISGRREMTEALTEAYRFAFSPDYEGGATDDK